jgi:DNA-binding NarL/FixJ family response regulator
MTATTTAAPAKAKILLVDDHPLIRQGLAQLISNAPDLDVCADVEDAESAMAFVKKSRPDLVIVDLSLKGRSGLDLVKDLKAFDAALPVLVLSMHDETLHAERALRAGAQGYIMKEEATENVLEAVRKVLRGDIYVSQRVTSRMLHKLVTTDAPTAASPLQALTDREHEVFLMIGKGMPAREIAAKLNLSSKTVDAHRETSKPSSDSAAGRSCSATRCNTRWTATPSRCHVRSHRFYLTVAHNRGNVNCVQVGCITNAHPVRADRSYPGKFTALITRLFLRSKQKFPSTY